MRRHYFWVRVLSLAPLEVINSVGERTRPFGRFWSIAVGAWLLKATRLGIEI